MTRLLAVLLCCLSVPVLAETCEEKWPTDFSMQAYCKERQAQGIHAMLAWRERYNVDDKKIVEKLQNDESLNVAETIYANCASKWHTDFSMIAYCLGEQTKAAKSLGKL